MNTSPIPATAVSGDLYTINQYIEKRPCFTNGGLRYAIFHAGEELEQVGAIVRFGRKILIDDDRFMSYIRDGGLKQIGEGK
jgi:hypothetical protein